jgi:hypothetical protein
MLPSGSDALHIQHSNMNPSHSQSPSPQSISSPGLLSAAVGAAACAGCPAPTSEDRYRFYRCVLEPLHVTCKPIGSDEIRKMEPSVNTMLMPIESWIPSIADRAIIRWRLFENRRLEIVDT